MAMGATGGSMGGMQMPLPENTLPMMAGEGPFGGIEMGGMFTVFKIREGLARDDYTDPGWFKHPTGSVAYPLTGEAPDAARNGGAAPEGGVEVQVRKPTGGMNH